MNKTDSTFRAGYSRVNITPPLGVSLGGHPHPDTRTATEVLDDLEINTVAVSAGGRTAVLFSADLLYIRKVDSEKIRRLVAEENNIPYESIFIACTHTHTGPLISVDHLPGFELNEKSLLYKSFLPTRFSDAAKAAIADLKPAKMGYAVGRASGISFIRRFRMKDGTVRTNPGQGNPDIVAPIGEVDERVNVLRIVREGGKEIAIANFGVHPDTIGAVRKISADYPRAVREAVEAVMPVHCVFFNGAQGDVNHFNVNAKPKVLDDFLAKNDAVDRNYNFSQHINTKHIGRTIAGALLQVYGDVEWVDVDTVAYGNMDCIAPTNMPTAGVGKHDPRKVCGRRAQGKLPAPYIYQSGADDPGQPGTGYGCPAGVCRSDRPGGVRRSPRRTLQRHWPGAQGKFPLRGNTALLPGQRRTGVLSHV